MDESWTSVMDDYSWMESYSQIIEKPMIMDEDP